MYALIKDLLKNEAFSKLDVISQQPLNSLICNFHKLSDEEAAYAKNPLTHIDFLIFSTIDKSPMLAIEVDGYAYHNDNIKQSQRDKLKDSVLENTISLLFDLAQLEVWRKKSWKRGLWN